MYRCLEDFPDFVVALEGPLLADSLTPLLPKPPLDIVLIVNGLVGASVTLKFTNY
jgi:hypothetical protein